MNKLTKRKKFKEEEAKRKELEVLYERLNAYYPESDEYKAILARIEDLHKTDRSKVNPNTIVTGAFSTIPVIGIIVYEAFGNIIKTKALNFVTKVKF